MKHALGIWVAVAFLSTSWVVAAESKEEREVVTQTFDVGKNPTLTLANLNGGARIEGWDKKSIEVIATKTTNGSRERLEDARVDFDMKNDHLRIDVEYDSNDHWNNDGVSVTFEIHVPYGTEVENAKLVNGDLEIRELSGDVEASSVNGEVTGAKLSGDVHLSTVNGDVFLASAGKEPIRLKSVNGNVVLVLPRDANAKLSISTVHGDIRGDMGNGVKYAGSSMDTVLGSGGRRIEIGTVNGDVKVRRGEGSGERGSDDDSE